MSDFDPDAYLEDDGTEDFDPKAYAEDKTDMPTTNERGLADHIVHGLARHKIFQALGLAGDVAAEANKELVAPIRAGMAAQQRGEGFMDAAGEQFVAGMPELQENGWPKSGELLPTTPKDFEPVMTKMYQNLGASDGVAETAGKVHGTVMDAIVDPTMLIPGKAVTEGLGAMRKEVLNGVSAAEHAVAPPLMATGRFMTAGTLNFTKAVKAAKNLTARELLLPGNKDYGPMAEAIKDVGDARQALQADRITVPGSRGVAMDALTLIGEAKARSVAHPNADAMMQKIEGYLVEPVERVVSTPIPDEEVARRVQEMEQEFTAIQTEFEAAKQRIGSMSPETRRAFAGLQKRANELGTEYGKYKTYLWQRQNPNAAGMVKPMMTTKTVTVMQPRELTLNELDDVTGMLDELVYTGAGNEKYLRRVWGPAVKKSRAALDKVMQTIPEGVMFKAKKSHLEDLHTAVKGRSRIAGIAAGAGALGTLSVGAVNQVTSDKEMGVGALLAIPLSVLSVGILPQTYMRLMGVLKVPGEITRSLLLAQQSGKATMMREALQGVVKQNPALAERIARGTLLAASKAFGDVNEEEAASLGKIRIFDPEQVAAEKLRLQNDRSMPSGERGRRLSDINRNGYVTMDGPVAEPEPAPEPQFNDGQKGLADLLKTFGAH